MSFDLRRAFLPQVGAASRAQYLAQMATVGVAYYVAAWLSLRISLVGGVVTPIWPPTGIAVVALLGLGPRVWPAVTVAALVVNLPINSSITTALLIALGNTFAPLLAARLMRAAGFRWQLDRLRDALVLVFLGALVAMVVSATFGTTALLLDDTISRGQFGSTWALWWAGDGTGVLVFAPLLFSLYWLRRLTWRRALELAVVIGGLTAVGYLVFRTQTQDTYLVFPLVIWAAVRFRQLGASLAAVTVVAMATWAAEDQVGPFEHVPFLHRVLTLQACNAVVALTSFVLAAVIAERMNALAHLRVALDREHGITETLQRSLLPESLPVVPGVEFASRYLPGGAGLQVGGDWYDVVLLPRGRIGLTIGDVVGRGLGAAAAMGQLRTAIRAYALECASPAAVLERMSALVSQFDAAQMTTLVYAVLDPEAETLTYASAGHPPPLLLGPDGTATYLEGGRSLPLGLTSAPRTEAVTTIAAGATLILYTDGLVERRGSSIDEGLEALRRAVEGDHDNLNALCDDRVLAALRPEAANDDVAVLATKLLPVTTELRLSLPSEPEVIASLRRALRLWAVHMGAGSEEADDLVHAASEAASNVVEHAYGPAGGVLELHATYHERCISVVIRDRGRWRSQRDVGQGRGLELIRGLVDEAQIVRSPTGTEVRLQRRLGGAATADQAINRQVAAARPALESEDEIDMVRLSGDVDLANATTLYHEIISHVRPNSVGVVIDLSEVEHLDSSGVRLLMRVAERLGPRRHGLCIVAPPESPAFRILQLSGFDGYRPVVPTVAAATAVMRTSAHPSGFWSGTHDGLT
jgi:anti-anti-sigma factor